MSDEPRDTPLEHLLDVFGQGLLYGLRTSLPGKITAYDATKQKASVKPLIKDGHLAEDETRVVKSLPEVHGVPVMFLGPARARTTWPVAVDDLCLVFFTSSSIRRWLQSGGEVDPGDDRRHDINDAIALVGLHNFGDIPTSAPTDAYVVHCDTGVKAKIGGPTGTEPTLMGDTYRTAEDNLLTALTVLTTAISTFAGLCVTVPVTTPATALAAAVTAFNAAVTAFKSAGTTYKTLTAEVK